MRDLLGRKPQLLSPLTAQLAPPLATIDPLAVARAEITPTEGVRLARRLRAVRRI